MASVAQTLQRALAHHRAGELDQAEGLYREIVRIDPRHADALHLLGLTAHQRKKSESAVDYISRAISVSDRFAPYHSNLGVAYRALGDISQAIASLQTALQIDPDYADAHFNLGTLLHEEGSLVESRAHLEHGLRINAGYAPAWVELGQVLELLGDVPQAIESLRRGVQIQPSLAEAQCQLAALLVRENQLDAAVAAYRQAVKAQPQIAQREAPPYGLLNRLAVLADAAAGYERTLEIDRRSRQILDHLVERVAAAERLTAPCEHFSVSEAFPEDFYGALLQFLPETRYFEELSDGGATLPNGRSARLHFKLDEAGLRKLPEPARTFWTGYAPLFLSDRLKFAIFGKFGRKLHARPQVQLLRDVAGYPIPPHLDIPQKKVTVQFCLPADDSRLNLGKTLYVKEAGAFRPACLLPFRRNMAHTVLVSDGSWHGVEQSDLGGVPRNSLVIAYYRS